MQDPCIYPSATHFQLKPCVKFLAHNLFLNCPIVSKFCTEHGSDTAMLCAKFQNNWTTEMDVVDKQYLQDLSLIWFFSG